jgi:prophage regulatory protein
MSAAGESLLRIEKVSERVGFGKNEIYVRMRTGRFPKRIKIGRLSVWVESEIDGWIADQIRAGRGEKKTR